MTADANQMKDGRWALQIYDALNRPVRMEEVQLILPFPQGTVQYLYDHSTEMPFTERTVLSETWYDSPTASPDPSQGGGIDLGFKANDIVKEADLAATNRGRITMTRTRILHPTPALPSGEGDEGDFLATAYYYDERGQMIQSVAENILGGADRISTAYLWNGAVDKVLQESVWLNGEEQLDTLRLLMTYTYDDLQRPLTTVMTINDEAPVTVSAMEYDELLRAKTKRLHGNAETIDYTYNIKNWPTAIASNLFTEELFYDRPLGDVAPRYNGDITAVRWRTARQGTRAYAFTYDDLSRLIHSQFSVIARDEAINSQFSNDYTENLTYDPTGRIQTLQRYVGGNQLIDDLQYSYTGAHLQQVNDRGTPAGVPVGGTTYKYDLNGNITFDGTTQIAYNLLNLPRHINLLGGRSLKNTYAADGRKLITDAQYTTGDYEAYRSYSGNLVFDINNNLDHIIMPEGRIVYNAYDSTFTFEYHLTDHLGNVRVAFSLPLGEGQGGVVVQENSYYPFGGLIRDFMYSSNGWVENTLRYNSKELLGEFDLGWYDYGSRYYNPMLGMFMAAARGYGLHPYAYCANNPVLYVDPNGEWFGIDDAIAALIGGVVNLALNWNNIEGFWDGLATFGIGAGAGWVTYATAGAGAGVWAVIGIGAAGGAAVSANNSIVAQTGANFEGIEDVDWGKVGKQAVIGGVAGGAGSAAGYAFLVNGVSSPILRSAVVSPLAAGAGHIAGGTTANLIDGQNLGEAFANSFDGLGQSMAIGGIIGVATTAGVSYANGVNPITGNRCTQQSIENYRGKV